MTSIDSKVQACTKCNEVNNIVHLLGTAQRRARGMARALQGLPCAEH